MKRLLVARWVEHATAQQRRRWLVLGPTALGVSLVAGLSGAF